MKTKYKRLTAYLIDSIIIALFMSLVGAVPVVNKAVETYSNATQELSDKYTEIMDREEIEFTKDDIQNIKEDIYNINSYGGVYFSLEILIMILYYIGLQFILKGQTIGKKLMKIKVVTIEDDEVSLGMLLLRGILLYGIIFSIANIVSVEFLGVNKFYDAYTIIGALKIILSLLIYVTILFRKDERGLHDLICKTKVIEA